LPVDWTDEDVTALRTAILTVARTGQRVQFGDRVVERANLKDMMTLLESIEQIVTGTVPGSLTRFASYDKGLGA
jgi:hypothetical protein